MAKARLVLATMLLLGCSCAFHSFHIEPRFIDDLAWEPSCEAMRRGEDDLGTWSVSYRATPYVFADLHPNAGIWVLDIAEYASRRLESRAEDRQLLSMVLRCGADEPIALPAVACLAPEKHYYGWASSTIRNGTRIYVDASALASGGSRGTTERPCALVAEIRHGTQTDEASSEVLVRDELAAWVHYGHTR